MVLGKHTHGQYQCGTIIETTPVKRNAYYGIEIDCEDLERYVKNSEKQEFEKFLTK